MNEIMKSEGRPDNPIEYREYIREKFGEEEGARIAASVGGIGKAIKNYGYSGMTEFDEKKQKPVFISKGREDKAGNAKQAEAAAKAKQKEEPQDWARGVRVGSFIGTDKEGNEYLHETGQQILRNINASEVAQVNRLKPETLKALFAIRKSINELAHTVEKEATDKGETTQQGNIIRKFVVEVENKYAGEGVTPKQQSSPLAGGTTQEELNKARSQHPPGAFG
jgi:hypothetical protein